MNSVDCLACSHHVEDGQKCRVLLLATVVIKHVCLLFLPFCLHCQLYIHIKGDYRNLIKHLEDGRLHQPGFLNDCVDLIYPIL